MTSNRKITVDTWSESQAPVISTRRAQQRLVPPTVLGILGSALLHFLVFQSVVSGYRAHKPHLPEVRGSARGHSDIAAADNLVLIDLVSSKIHKEDDDPPIFTRVSIQMTPLPALRPEPQPLPDLGASLGDEQESAAPSESDGGNERARLAGIYSNQIKSRVERIWRRPRTPVNEGMDASKTANSVEYFQCRVQVVQDPRGNVQEVLLPDCNGSVKWQRSLVVAIQQASPLPAPPSPTVFNRTIALDFVGYPYDAGASDEEYELEPTKTALTTVADQR